MKDGLWANIHRKRARIKAGSGERMRRPGEEGRPTKQDFKRSQEEMKSADRKPEMYTDPEGKRRVRMVPVDKDVNEKKLTPAEIKKREEIAKSIERDNPNMPMDKKMAIATATAKRVAEQNDFSDRYNAAKKKLQKMKKGSQVSFTHATTGKKVTGTYQGLRNMGGKSYAHVEHGDGATRVPVHQIHQVQEAARPPFEGPYTKSGTVTDKSGAKHTPMSLAKHLAKMARKKAMKKEAAEVDEAYKVPRLAMKSYSHQPDKNAIGRASDEFDMPSSNRVKLRGFGSQQSKGNMGNPAARAALKPKKESAELDESVAKAYEIMKPTKSMSHGIEAIKKVMKVDHNTATNLAKQVMAKVKKGEFKESVEEANSDQNFSKRIGATVRGGAGAEYLKKKADQRRADAAKQDPGGTKKGLGPAVVDRQKAYKKAKEKGLPPGSRVAYSGTYSKDKRRLPEKNDYLQTNMKKRKQANDQAVADMKKDAPKHEPSWASNPGKKSFSDMYGKKK